VLAAEMAEQPRNVLQKLVEIAVELCDADTAGVSLLDGDVFRWEAVAGVFAGARGGTMPRAESPCGVCIDRDATQLMYLADRCFPALAAEPRFVEALLIPFHDRGRPIGTVWVASHTADRKFDREDERVVSVLAKFAAAGWQLWTGSEATADVSRRKDDFLATLAHELRNPLAAITAAAANLRHRVGDDVPATRAVEVIHRQSRHASRLVDDLFDIARIGTGKLKLDITTVDLRRIIVDAIDARRAQIARRQQQLRLELGSHPVFIEGDAVRLTQVVSNLIDNAAKFTPDRGEIVVSLSSDDDGVVVAVRDTGIGISAGDVEAIFNPSMQVDSSNDASSAGLGLGLALVRSLTELHGGQVTVTSAGADQGSCFTVRSPAYPRSETIATDGLRLGSTSRPLFWSKRGDVACAAHAPDVQSPRWQTEGWVPISNVSSHRPYQCPLCAPDGRRQVVARSALKR
jgi:signal transduction histidine kinase